MRRLVKDQNPIPPQQPTPSTITGKLNPSDEALIALWRFDWRAAAAQLGRISHRDLAGTIIPFHFNYAQMTLFVAIMRMLQLTLIMLYDAAKRGEDVAVPNLVYRVEHGLPIYPHEIPLRLIVGKSRRFGLSIVIQWIMTLRMNCLNNYPCLLMAHDEESANKIGNYAREFWDRWPKDFQHLRHGYVHSAEGRLHLKNGSDFDVFTAGTKEAKESSRGWRFDFYHFSEYAHYKSYTEAQACAAVAPPHAWIFKESTGNGPSGPFYREWKKALTIEDAERAYFEKDYETLKKWDGLPLKHEYKIFFSWLEDPGLTAPVMEWEREEYSYSKLDDYERALLAKFPEKFTHGKIKWRRITIEKDCQRSALPPGAYFAQEWPATPEEMFQATGSKVFASYEALTICEMLSESNPPLFRAILDGVSTPVLNPLLGANLLVYKLPDPTRSYLIGLDPKMGAVNNKDEHAITVWDQYDGTFFEEVACLFDGNLDAKAIGHIATMLAELFNNAFITPEIQGGGLAVASTIVGDNGYTRVYERQTLDAIGGKHHTNYFRFGVFSTEQMKDHMVQTMRAVMREKRILIRTLKLIDQFRGFERIEKKYGGPEDELDDGVMSSLLGIYGGIAQGKPNSRGLRKTELERNQAVIQEAMSPAMAEFARQVAAKVARDVRKNLNRRDLRANMDKKAKKDEN